MSVYAVGPVPAAIERVKTVKFLTDDDNSTLLSGPTCEISDRPLDFVSSDDSDEDGARFQSDIISDLSTNELFFDCDAVDVADHVIVDGTEDEMPVVRIPRRRQPRHGLGDLTEHDANAPRAFRTNVSREPHKVVENLSQAVFNVSMESFLSRAAVNERKEAQRRAKADRLALAKKITTLPKSDLLIMAERARVLGMEKADVPLYSELYFMPINKARAENKATRFWGAVAAVRDHGCDYDFVIERFQLGISSSELEFYVDKDVEKYLCLHPTDFQFLADEVLAKRDAAMDAQIDKQSALADQYIKAVCAKTRMSVKENFALRSSKRKK